jgi:metallo-beta-lactamase class B
MYQVTIPTRGYRKTNQSKGTIMKKITDLFHLCLLVFSLTLSISQLSNAQELSAATDGQRPADATPQTQEYVGPIQLFDNFYYVGTTFVSAYLLVTDEGLILFDSLYNEFTAQLLQSVEEIGFDPEDIKYVLVTHGHNDHAGGSEEVREASGARIGMSVADWAMLDQEIDLVFEDGDSLVLGNTTIEFFITPGHTPGVLSMRFPVRDGDDAHQAFLFGGHNVTSRVAENFEWFIDSVQRLQRDLPSSIAVNLTSHPWGSLIFQRAEMLNRRQPGQPHPFVEQEDFDDFLDERLANARQRLAALPSP